MYGADTQQLRDLAKAFDAAADRLIRAANQLSYHVETAPWRGASGDRFRASWLRDGAPKLRRVAGDLHAAAQDLRRNADEQDRASGVGSGSDGMTAPGVTPGGFSIWPAIDFIGTVWGLGSAARDLLLRHAMSMTAVGKSFTLGGRLLVNADWASHMKPGATALSGVGAGFAVISEIRDTGWEDFGASLAETGWSPQTIKNGLYESLDSLGNYGAIMALAPPLAPIGAFIGLTTGAGKLGMAMGDGLWDAGLGDTIMDVSITGDIMRDIDDLDVLHDEALRAGDFEEANRISGMMSDLADKAKRESSGAKGLLNAVVGVGEGIGSAAMGGIKKAGRWLNPFD
jgi:hypothetical protein